LIFVLFVTLTLTSASANAATQDSSPPPTVTVVAHNLNNPRGIAIFPDGRLLVSEAGTGRPDSYSARISIFEDINADGDYDDPDEQTPLLTDLPSYNAYTQFNPGRDEVLGVSDVILLEDGRIIYTMDDHFENIQIVEFDPATGESRKIIDGVGTLNSLVYDPGRELLFVAESSLNMVTTITLDGERNALVIFPPMASEQQAVPAGLAIDPTTGDLLVALFSGNLFDYYGTILSYMPGDAKIVRVDPDTGEYSDEITGLTAAVDVAIDEQGRVFALEMATRWPPPPLFRPFDLYDPDPASPPDDGGYGRFEGRVSMLVGDELIRLADGLDTPTNIAVHDGVLTVSTGQGTPGRMIFGDEGRTPITGQLVQIADYD